MSLQPYPWPGSVPSLLVSVLYIFMLLNTLLSLLISSGRTCVMVGVRVTDMKVNRGLECNIQGISGFS